MKRCILLVLFVCLLAVAACGGGAKPSEGSKAASPEPTKAASAGPGPRLSLRKAASVGAARSVSAGFNYTVGLRSDGTAVARGDEDYGECDVTGWSDLVAVSAGSYHAVGLRSDGTAVATGSNDHDSCDVTSWILATQPPKQSTGGLRLPAAARDADPVAGAAFGAFSTVCLTWPIDGASMRLPSGSSATVRICRRACDG